MKIKKEDIPKNIESLLRWDIECIGIVIPRNLEKNIEDFQKVLSKFRFKSQIHTVMKVNTSHSLLETGKKLDCRVDVSSYGELQKALSVGYTWGKITANGPKNERFLKLCIKNHVTIAIDSITELEILNQLLEWAEKQKILVRISGFEASPATRFWVLREYWEKSVSIIQWSPHKFDILGYSFHIDRRDIETRKSVFWESLWYIKLLQSHGIRTKVINIGWGYWTRYQDDTRIKHNSCTRFHLGSRLYPQDDGPIGAYYLSRLLSDEKNGLSIGKFLEENNIELWIEPGRSLMQNVWYWATRIISLRHDGLHQSLVLDANSFSLGMREEELPTDPFLLGEDDGKQYEYSLLGNLCLESDIFFCRCVNLLREAQIWDIIIFPDIGAYHTDFYETESISHPKKSRYFQVENTLYPDNF